jgi:hypothetical protein
MNKKNSWLITLLLAALVPFATGCDDKEACNDARSLEHSASQLSDMIQGDIRMAEDRQIDWRTTGKYELQCKREQAIAADLNSEKVQKMFDKKKDDFCDEDGKSHGMCDAFLNVRNGVNGRKFGDGSDLTTRGIFKLLQDACSEQAAGGRLDIGNLNNRHSKPLRDEVKAMQEIFAGQINGNAKRLADKVCKGSEPVTIVNTTIAVRAPDTPGNYQTPISYTGPSKPATPPAPPAPAPQPPNQAPQPGEVPVVPPVAAPAIAASAALPPSAAESSQALPPGSR